MSSERLLSLIRKYSFKTGTFTLASGKTSSYYIDMRRTALTAEGGKLIGSEIISKIRSLNWPIDAIGGMTLGADPLATATVLAAWDAKLKWSSFIVRKQPKGHGAKSQIEIGGDLHDGANVVVLDDTITTGGSTIRAIKVLREAGYNVVGAIAIVDRQEGAKEALVRVDVPFASLYTVKDLRA